MILRIHQGLSASKSSSSTAAPIPYEPRAIAPSICQRYLPSLHRYAFHTLSSPFCSQSILHITNMLPRILEMHQCTIDMYQR